MASRYEGLEAALKDGNDQPLLELSKGCPEVTAADSFGSTLLHSAVRRDRRTAAAHLLKVGADPNAKNERYHRTPLHYAVMESDLEMVDLLLGAGAQVDARDSSEMTPLLWAPTNHKGDRTVASIITRLVEAGADVAANSENGSTAMHRAAFEGSLGAICALLAAGADCDPRTAEGVSPLHVAAGNGAGSDAQESYLAIVERLLDAGADINAASTGPFYLWSTRHAARRTPLDIAKRHRHSQIAELLESRGYSTTHGRAP